MDTTNDIIKKVNEGRLKTAQASPRKLKNDDQIEQESKIKGADKTSDQKVRVPLGDCIQMEYSDSGELASFSIRPQLAQFVFKQDESDISSLKEILKVVMYMNRLLHDSDNLILGRRKTLVRGPGDNRHSEVNDQSFTEDDIEG